jgi:ribulose-phosphate 3-epimerase
MRVLAPSILSADLTNLSQQIRLVEMGGADWIHCDIMDGHFVPNITFGPILVQAVKRVTNLPLDVHLMIKNPDNYLEAFIKAGASIISVHLEEVVHLNRTVNRIKELGAKAGVVLNPSTPVSLLKDIANDINLVLLMSVNPGFGGQSFILNSLNKIAETSKLRKELDANFIIEVDGGIDFDNVNKVLTSGCDAFVIGNSIFGTEDITTTTLKFKKIITSGKKIIT